MKAFKAIAAATRVASVLLAFGFWAAATAEAQTTDPRVADLVRAGKLHVGLFLPQYGKGTDGLKTSVWVETARAYAARVGIALVIVEHATPPEAIACLKAGACDLLFLPLDARAAGIGDFSNPIFQFDYTLMVPAGSAITKVDDADRPGVRIAAVRNHASTNEFVRQVKQAEFVYAETPGQALALLRDGKADAMASARPDLLLLSTNLAGARILADRYGAMLNRIVVPKGRMDWRTHANEFVEEAKASGAVQQFIERGGTRGINVAGGRSELTGRIEDGRVQALPARRCAGPLTEQELANLSRNSTKNRYQESKAIAPASACHAKPGADVTLTRREIWTGLARPPCRRSQKRRRGSDMVGCGTGAAAGADAADWGGDDLGCRRSGVSKSKAFSRSDISRASSSQLSCHLSCSQRDGRPAQVVDVTLRPWFVFELCLGEKGDGEGNCASR